MAGGEKARLKETEGAAAAAAAERQKLMICQINEWILRLIRFDRKNRREEATFGNLQRGNLRA